METNIIYNADCLEGLKSLPDNCVHCCVTSPPYWGLRDYDVEGQLGLEGSPNDYVEKMVQIFTEVKRVLRDDGTLWLNLGDTYWGGGFGKENLTEQEFKEKYPKQGSNLGAGGSPELRDKLNGLRKVKIDGLKPKDLVGIPWMVAFALRNSGWYLRQDIIWNKPNPMPESVKDRCTKAHEYIFLMSKSKKYFYDHEAIKTPIKDATVRRMIQDIESQNGSNRVPCRSNGKMKAVLPKRTPRPSDNRKGNQGTGRIPIGLNGSSFKNHSNYLDENGELIHSSKANKKSVWEVTTKGYSEAHFATYPEKLIVDCIKAGCPEDGIVLDPFMGAGTSAVVARKLNRNYIGFELNPEYIEIAERRLSKELGMFK